MPHTAPFDTELVALSALVPHPRNYKTHPQDQLDHLVESIRAYGIYRNIVIARDQTILAGHGVVQAARALGMDAVPVVRLDLDPHDPRALKLVAGDNEIQHLAEVDDRALTDLLKEIKDTDSAGLLGTGYDDAMLAALLLTTRPASEIADSDAAAAWAGMPEYAPEPEPLALLVRFRGEEDRAEFARRLDIALSDHVKSTWWPAKERDDVRAVRIAE